MITVFAASPALDITYLVPELVVGAIHRPAEVFREAGGKALNAGRAASTMGADVQAVAVLGGPLGAAVAERARAAGLRLVTVPIAAETRICVSIASDSGLTEVYEKASAVSAGEWQLGLDALMRALGDDKGWVIISGGMPASLPDSALAELIGLITSAGGQVAVDSHGTALRAVLETSRPHFLKVNVQEAAEALDSASRDAGRLASELQQRTTGLVVVTDGANGSVCTDGETVTRALPMGDIGAFPVGSGDSFLGGFVASLDSGLSAVDSLRVAVACGTANAAGPGPARFSPRDVQALVPQVRLVQL